MGEEWGPIIKGIDLTLARGEVLGVIGESGSGKSTLAPVITGLLPPSKGSVIYNGNELARELTARPKEQLRVMQMIYQMPDTALNPKQRICIARALAADKEILTPPHHDYTDLLLSSVPEMDPDWLDSLLKKCEEKDTSSLIMDACR